MVQGLGLIRGPARGGGKRWLHRGYSGAGGARGSQEMEMVLKERVIGRNGGKKGDPWPPQGLYSRRGGGVTHPRPQSDDDSTPEV